jgi:hypothetical protein
MPYNKQQNVIDVICAPFWVRLLTLQSSPAVKVSKYKIAVK